MQEEFTGRLTFLNSVSTMVSKQTWQVFKRKERCETGPFSKSKLKEGYSFEQRSYNRSTGVGSLEVLSSIVWKCYFSADV